ncbi:MAG: DUF4097 family beta strand repeat-containing protein [Phycisphaerae bacterium]|jgi:hypothetical protein
MRYRLVVPVLVALLAVMSGCTERRGGNVKATRDFALTSPWNDFQTVVVESRNGSIEIGVADVREVEIDGRMSVRGMTRADADAALERMRIDVDPAADAGRTLTIRLVVPDELRQQSPSAGLKVRVPQGCAVRLTTSNGSIEAGGLKDRAELRTSNASVTVTDFAGRVDIRTSNGSVVARRVDGPVDAQSSNASITVEEVGGDCTLATTNGSITLRDVQGSVRARTSNASIGCDVQPPAGASVVLETSNGKVDVTLPETLAAELTLVTSNGKISTAFGNAQVNMREMGNKSVRATMNGGGGRVEARTSNGAITFGVR